MANRNKNNRVAELIDHSRRQRGYDREHHFANGGSLSDWRGIRNVQLDRVKEANRRLCRDEIDDELYDWDE